MEVLVSPPLPSSSPVLFFSPGFCLVLELGWCLALQGPFFGRTSFGVLHPCALQFWGISTITSDKCQQLTSHDERQTNWIEADKMQICNKPTKKALPINRQKGAPLNPIVNTHSFSRYSCPSCLSSSPHFYHGEEVSEEEIYLSGRGKLGVPVVVRTLPGLLYPLILWGCSLLAELSLVL